MVLLNSELGAIVACFLLRQGRLDAVWALFKRQYDRVSLMRPTTEDKVSQLRRRVADPAAFCLKPHSGSLSPHKLLPPPRQSQPDVLGFFRREPILTSRASVDSEIIELCLIPKMNSVD